MGRRVPTPKGVPTASLEKVMAGLHQGPNQAAQRLKTQSVLSPNQLATLVGMHTHMHTLLFKMKATIIIACMHTSNLQAPKLTTGFAGLDL